VKSWCYGWRLLVGDGDEQKDAQGDPWHTGRSRFSTAPAWAIGGGAWQLGNGSDNVSENIRTLKALRCCEEVPENCCISYQTENT
jgi:hypothetical protein